MASAMDRSLDDIIASKPRKSFNRKFVPKKSSGSRITKANHASSSKLKTSFNTSKKVAPVSLQSSLSTLDASYATKCVVYGLPKDIKQDSIKEFFQSQIGAVQTVALSYNEKGQSKGIATIIFKNSSSAQKAVEKYNGAPLDNGASKLKIELILDPSKKPLSARIQPNAPTKPASNITKKNLPLKSKNSNSNYNGNNNNNNNNNKLKSKGKPRTKKPKKTLEDLDQEMTDYFSTKD
ncbi:RNA-binding protein YRA1 ASCRUDRAFT_13510 [Ascoidea rubescens DSM 1968]|uniref:RRM domain-containing protein n=1 Tax=Ascoidea rubescens DSM 1968 TaxID=1344418 RepID=A0A1D2VHK9_9ASCO|nr:hypothetical protein ASCRUDRAFT_13510 [Ascoidea rubescens DSM 1968]ODV61138.1 hypothetical protein ASCRUDRAFT_13510 [Ascoidea rubescens DSM 1968]